MNGALVTALAPSDAAVSRQEHASMAQGLAEFALAECGCHAAVIEALRPSEASQAVWGLAALFASMWHGADAIGRQLAILDGRDPDAGWWYFISSGEAPRGTTYFLGAFWETKVRAGELGLDVPEGWTWSEAEVIENDTRALRTWLGYAKGRLQRIERRLLVGVVAEALYDRKTRRKIARLALGPVGVQERSE